MAVLERVTQMKNEGYSESQIIDLLKEEGISPKEINNALSQSRIKSELSKNPMNPEIQEMRPTLAEPSENEEYNQEGPSQEYNEYQSPNQYDTTLATQPEGYYQQPYQEYQPPQQPADIETINEIAEQIVEEKNAELKKQISTFKNSNEEIKSEIEGINQRLQKIENNFNELQMAIIKKIGEYGENIKNIADEMHENQNSFSKILNPLTDNIRYLQKIQGNTEKPISTIQEDKTLKQTSQDQPRKRKTEPGFEDYLR